MFLVRIFFFDSQCEQHSSFGPSRGWTCPAKRVKCADGLQCVPVAHLCDGRSNCRDGSDEKAVEIAHGLVNNCSLPLSPCVAISRQWWLDAGRPGARCDGSTCLDRTKFCDGACDCEGDCLDEDHAVCRDWNCSEGFFKCFSTGKCIPANKVCDGNFDCEADSSDEANCPCDEDEEQEKKSSYLR